MKGSLSEAEPHAVSAPDAFGAKTARGMENAIGRARQGVPAEDEGQLSMSLVVAQIAVAQGRAHAEGPDAADRGRLEPGDRGSERARHRGLAPEP